MVALRNTRSRSKIVGAALSGDFEAAADGASSPLPTKEHQVAEILREKIFTGVLSRGQKLKQVKIAQMLDTSITPVRAALKLL